MLKVFKMIWWLIAAMGVYIIYPIVKWTAIVVSKITLYALIALLKALRDILIFTFNVIFIDSLTMLLKKL